MKEKVSVYQIRLGLFVLSVVFYLMAYFLFVEGVYMGGASSFFNLLGMLSVFLAFSYKVKEEPLRYSLYLEDQVDVDRLRLYLILILVFGVMVLVGGYLSYRNISRVGYLTQVNFGYQVILVYIMMITFSFWERRRDLKK